MTLSLHMERLYYVAASAVIHQKIESLYVELKQARES